MRIRIFLYSVALITVAAYPATSPAAEKSNTFTIQQKIALRKLEMAAAPDTNADKKLQPKELVATIPGKFAQIDTNGDRIIDETEVAKAMDVFRARYTTVYGNSTEPHVTRVKNRYAQMDTNKNGSVSYGEFSAYFSQRYGQFDQNGDGVITADEYRVDAEKLEIGF